MIRAVRESGGSRFDRFGRRDGCRHGRHGTNRRAYLLAPEGGATLAALRKLIERKMVEPDERVVLLVTGNGHKYLDMLAG